MIKIISFLLVLNTGVLYAQDFPRPVLKKTMPQSIPGKDTILPRVPFQQMVPRSSMPNLFLAKPDQPIYRGNNGKGSDIHESKIDNMSILVPDTSFYSAMPNGMQSLKTRMDTLSEMMNKRKQWDGRYRFPKK